MEFFSDCFDTAGIRTSENSIEKEGVLRSKDVIKNSDIVFHE
jgi:tRNA U34 5-carboxymethylaminomethyl modifying GTPase MnmE/TrmE